MDRVDIDAVKFRFGLPRKYKKNLIIIGAPKHDFRNKKMVKRWLKSTTGAGGSK